MLAAEEPAEHIDLVADANAAEEEHELVADGSAAAPPAWIPPPDVDDVTAWTSNFFQRYMQRLLASPTYSSDRRACKEKGVSLLFRMKKAEQSPADFEDEQALWGYTALKFVERGQRTCLGLRKAELLSSEGDSALAAALDALTVPSREFHVLSLGGGPANDLLGAVLYREQRALRDQGSGVLSDNAVPDWWVSEPNQGSDFHYFDTLKLTVADLFTQWAPIVEEASNAAMGMPIHFLQADVSRPLTEPINQALRAMVPEAHPALFLFSFVLFEGGSWSQFLLTLWEESAQGSVFFFNDPRRFETSKVEKLMVNEATTPPAAVEWAGDALLLVR